LRALVVRAPVLRVVRVVRFAMASAPPL
jgi:hypothetical protein